MNEDKLVVSLKAVKPEPQTPAPAPKKGWAFKLLVMGILALVIFGLLMGAYYIYMHASQSPVPAVQGGGGTAAQTPPAATAASEASSTSGDQTAQIISEVGNLIELPQGETPTVATVTDPSKLAGQAFFANAKAGDIVLLYTQAREAYLYDPSEHKLVMVAPLATSTP